MKTKRENPFLNLGFNVILPSILMSKAGDWFGIDPQIALVLALTFPLGYGVIDFCHSRRCNIFSVIGFVSVLLTGVIGLLKLPTEYIAIKEALLPLFLGLVVFISAFTRYPLIKVLVFNEAIMNVDQIGNQLPSPQQQFALQHLLSRGTLKIAGSFLLSAVLNFALAKYLVHSETGTIEFNKELARMTVWSYPVIVLPCTIVLMITLYQLVKQLTKLTGLSFEEMFVDTAPKNVP
ncbi:MAG: MFS transporter [Opitutales bacterium]|nr:MFS transporter [Opitutales bacterium]